MRIAQRTAVVLLLLAVVALPSAVLAEESDAGKVVLQFPAPGPSPSGLAWDGEALWVADNTTNSIYQLDPADGHIIASFKAPEGQVSGLAFGDGHLWCADLGSAVIRQLDTAGNRLQADLSCPLPQVQGRQPQAGGLAFHDGHLWTGTLAGWSSTMNQLDPADGTVKRSLFTKGYPVALALNDSFIWNATHNDGHRLGLVYCYGLDDGLFVSQFDTPGFWPVGLAWDGQYLWLVDRDTKAIYRLSTGQEVVK
jgi:sugar lactone lactonase YvrE